MTGSYRIFCLYLFWKLLKFISFRKNKLKNSFLLVQPYRHWSFKGGKFFPNGSSGVRYAELPVSCYFVFLAAEDGIKLSFLGYQAETEPSVHKL